MSVKRYEVNGTSSVFEDANGSLVDYEDYAALEAKCAALAAENAGLKSAIDSTIGWQQSTDPENVESVRMLVDINTPATDAYWLKCGPAVWRCLLMTCCVQTLIALFASSPPSFAKECSHETENAHTERLSDC